MDSVCLVRRNSYSFIPILSTLHNCFGHGLKICMWFGYNPQNIFCYFFYKMNYVIIAAKVNRYKVFCVLSCFMSSNIFKDKQKVVVDINSLNSHI